MDGPPATFPVSPFPWDPRREGARVPDTLGCSLRKPLLESHPQAAWRAPWSLEPGSADPGRMEGWEEVLAQGQAPACVCKDLAAAGGAGKAAAVSGR